MSGANQYRIPMVKYVPGKNISYSINRDNIRRERIFKILHCPFEGRELMLY